MNKTDYVSKDILVRCEQEYYRKNWILFKDIGAGFFYFLQNEYGIKPLVTHPMDSTYQIEIIDEGAYTKFLLRWG